MFVYFGIGSAGMAQTIALSETAIIPDWFDYFIESKNLIVNLRSLQFLFLTIADVPILKYEKTNSSCLYD